MTKRILISINTSWNIYHFRAPLIRALKEKDYQVITAAPEDAYTARLKTIVDRHINLSMQNAGTSLWQDALLFCRYLWLLHTVKPDVILTYTIKPNIYAAFAARLLGIPIINNVSGLGTVFIHNNWLTHVAKMLYRWAFLHSSCVFFQNPEDRDLFVKMKLVSAEKAALLPGSGIDLDYFCPAKEEQKNSEPICFVLIARMLWDKGVGEFVEAASIVKATYPQTVFRLVGPRGVQNKTSIPDAVIDQWVAEKKIEYLGERSDIREVMRAHDCVVLPSYREGMSRVLLEGAGVGKPLIATDVPGCKHVVEQGKNGFLCRVRDAQDLSKAMIEFIKLTPEQRTQMGRESRAKAEREFDQRLVLDSYLQKIATTLTS
jgi:glycosyltransferase involved in cell wall biosynthesis